MAKQKIKGSIWIDSLFATGFIYLFMYIVSNISAFQIFDAFDSIGQALEDMEMTDIAFSQLREPLPPDTSIVLVNFGPLDRQGIADQLKIIDKYKPKVIGIDSFFKGYGYGGTADDTLKTLYLSEVLTNIQAELVMVAKVDQTDSLAEIHAGEEVYDYLYLSDSMFIKNAHSAIANLDTDAEFQDDIKICRKFPPKREVLGTGEEYLAFAAKMAQLYDPSSTEPLLERDKDFEIINYRGDFVNFFDQSRFSTRFYALDWYQVLQEDFVPEIIEGKIVLFGYLGEEFGAAQWEDKFFTPLNTKIAGRANPDMFGPVIHANIVSMILNRDYVDSLTETQEIILGILLCYLNVLLFSYIYRNMGVWYDGATKLIQVIEVMLILFIIIQLFATVSFKLELSIGLFAVALAGDLLEVYYGVVRNVVMKLLDRVSKKKRKAPVTSE
ncbi:MAG: CHASE2 domain-containing protein [Fulvivirga sp.]|uniref:CHASE2 domain-containing protein n=1 Tax=Fulvivirga sp. TaxID=1931237 RepID=UPI0032EDE21E